MGALAEPPWEDPLAQQLMEDFLRVETWGIWGWELGHCDSWPYWYLSAVLPVASVRCISRTFGNGWFRLDALPSAFGSGPLLWL